MQALHVEATCSEDGVITLRNLPIHQGDSVEVLVIKRSSGASPHGAYPLRGESLGYTGLFDPVWP
jgi:hypothetical protein